MTISLVWWFDMKIVTRRVQICFENMIVYQEARRGVQGRAGNYEYECWSKYADIIIFIFITLIQRSPVVLSVTYLVFNLYFPTFFFFSTWTWAPHLTIHRKQCLNTRLSLKGERRGARRVTVCGSCWKKHIKKMTMSFSRKLRTTRNS